MSTKTLKYPFSGYAIQIKRKDGSMFLASGKDCVVAHYHTHSSALEFCKELREQLRAKPRRTTEMKTKTLTKNERSLLLYFEDCAVNKSGRVQSDRMNDGDREIAKRWDEEGFVQYGRIASEHITANGAVWCHLSDDAWKMAADERKARADRLWNNRNWQTTAEKRAA